MNRIDAIPSIDAALTKLGESILSDKAGHLFCVNKKIQLCGDEVEVELVFQWAADYDEAIERQSEKYQ